MPPTWKSGSGVQKRSPAVEPRAARRDPLALGHERGVACGRSPSGWRSCPRCRASARRRRRRRRAARPRRPRRRRPRPRRRTPASSRAERRPGTSPTPRPRRAAPRRPVGDEQPHARVPDDVAELARLEARVERHRDRPSRIAPELQREGSSEAGSSSPTRSPLRTPAAWRRRAMCDGGVGELREARPLAGEDDGVTRRVGASSTSAGSVDGSGAACLRSPSRRAAYRASLPNGRLTTTSQRGQSLWIATTQTRSFCRLCPAYCGVVVTLDGGPRRARRRATATTPSRGLHVPQGARARRASPPSETARRPAPAPQRATRAGVVGGAARRPRGEGAATRSTSNGPARGRGVLRHGRVVRREPLLGRGPRS